MSEKIQVKLIGEDGNIFNLLGIVSRELKRNNQDNKIEEMCNRVYNSNSYQEALSIIQDYVNIV